MSEKFREQLSALMDGELPSDELRFLLRRVQADGDLAQAWSRYQITSAILRRQVVLPLRTDFVRTVMINVGEGSSGRQPVATLVRWMGGGAIAAAVAVVALIGTKPTDTGMPAPASGQVASLPAPAQIRQDSAQAPAGVLPNLDFALPASYETPWVPVPRYDARFHNDNGTGDLANGLIPYSVVRIPEMAPAATPAQPAAAQHP